MASETAVLQLLASLDACYGGAAPWRELVDLPVAAREARRFKLDVSFALAAERMARFSINDKGEPEAFRARIRNARWIGLPSDEVEAFFTISPPGEVQTTIGLKWRPGVAEPDRVSLYLEELGRHPRGKTIRSAVVRLTGVEAPELPERASANAACVEWRSGKMLGTKVYDVFSERPDDAPARLPEGLSEIRDRLPFHAEMGNRRYMLATRCAANGQIAGHKLLWMTELHRPSLAERAWAELDRLIDGWETPIDATVAAALAGIRTKFDASDVFPFPDLVAFNVDAEGQREALIVHVSIR